VIFYNLFQTEYEHPSCSGQCIPLVFNVDKGRETIKWITNNLIIVIPIPINFSYASPTFVFETKNYSLVKHSSLNSFAVVLF